MIILFYSLTLIPLLIISLTAHEAGHYIAAKLLNIKTSAFQVGMGPKLIDIFTGRTRVTTGGQTEYLGRPRHQLNPGEKISLWIQDDPQGQHNAVAVHQPTGTAPDPLEPARFADLNRRHMLIQGKLNQVAEQELSIATNNWNVRPIPVAAAVFLPEAPNRDVRSAINTAPWRRQMAVILAGPAGNLFLMAVATVAMAIVPSPQLTSPFLVVTQLEQNGPAQQAGLTVGDRLLQVNEILLPNREQLRQQIRQASSNLNYVDLQVARQGEILYVQVYPHNDNIGALLEPQQPAPRPHSYRPQAVIAKIQRLLGIYASIIPAVAQGIQEPETPTPIAGPMLTAYQTGQSIQIAGLYALLPIAAAINFTLAVLNLLPIPPLDGYSATTKTVQAIRKGKPMQPRTERLLVTSGIILILLATIVVFASDLTRLID